MLQFIIQMINFRISWTKLQSYYGNLSNSWFLQRYYIPTARELARLAGIQRAPILHHFAESLAGAATIRAFDQEDRFIEANLDLIDSHSRPWFHNVSAMEWLSFRLNLLSNFVFAFSLVLLVTLPEGVINPSEYEHTSEDLLTAMKSSDRLNHSFSWTIGIEEESIKSIPHILTWQQESIEFYLNWHFSFCRHCRTGSNIWNKFECFASYSYMEHM